MGQCNYWWTIDKDEWCDLIDTSCSCHGSGVRCPLGSQAVSAVMRGEKITLQEAVQRIKRRSMREAS